MSSRIYTKLGDDGSTGRLFGGRVPKDDPLIETIGGIDETVAALGLARANATDEDLARSVLRVQRGLFVAGADLAANPHARDRLVGGLSLVTGAMVSDVEREIDELVARDLLRPVFVVPGATPTSAALDLARTVVRRAERSLVTYRRQTPRSETDRVLAYLNRVSDLLYVLARRAAGNDEEPASHEPSGVG